MSYYKDVINFGREEANRMAAIGEPATLAETALRYPQHTQKVKYVMVGSLSVEVVFEDRSYIRIENGKDFIDGVKTTTGRNST